MRHSTESKHEVHPFNDVGFGRVGRQSAVPIAVPPALHSANDAVYVTPAAVGAIERPDAFQLHAAARADRARRVGELAAAALGFFARPLLRLRADYIRYQQAQATYRALRGLDARILRDIGLDPSELHSIASEASALAAVTRIQLLNANSGR